MVAVSAHHKTLRLKLGPGCGCCPAWAPVPRHAARYRPISRRVILAPAALLELSRGTRRSTLILKNPLD